MKACVVLAENNFRRALSIVDKFEMAEVRLDLCKLNSNQIKDLFSHKKGLIATYRTENSNEDAHKMDMLKKALESGASYIDLEYDLDKSYIYEMKLFARNYNAKVIISYHNFDTTPDEKELNAIIKEAEENGADLVKVVSKTNSKEDAMRIMDLYKSESNLIAFGMGEDAKFTRIFSLFYGAPFTYVSYGNKSKTADGQLSHREFESIKQNLAAS